MSSHFTEISDDPSLPLSSLRLVVSPLRLICAAIWQTVQQNVVSDYGMLEEFVTWVTTLVPELLNPKQRAQLILGLRAKVIFELCHSEVTANLQNIQPHLDSLLTLAPHLNFETDDTDTGLSDFTSRCLIDRILKDPEEREHFFLNVFPKEFGSTFDAAIQGLTWEFLSKLEKLLPQPNLKKVASLLCDVHSVLEECVESISQLHGLKTLLDYYKDLSQLETSDISNDGSCITSAVCLQPVGKVVHTFEQTQSEPATLHACDHSLGEVKSTSLQSNGVEVETETVIAVESSGKWNENLTEEQETSDCGLDRREEVKSEVVYVIPEHDWGMGEPLSHGTCKDSLNCNEGAACMEMGCMATEDIHDERETVVVLEANEKHNFENDKSFKRLPSSRVRINSCKRPKLSSKQKQNLMFRARKMPSNKRAHSLEQNRVNTRDRLFICLKCGIKFKEKFTLKKHDAHCKKSLNTLESSKKLKNGSECEQSQLLARDMNNGVKPAKRVPRTYMEEEKIMDKTMAHASTVAGISSYKVIDSSLYCEVCTRAVQDLETLEKHKATHTPSQCNMCEENFPLFKQLVKHYEEVHKLSRPYICTNCQESFKSLSLFIRHEWKHTGYQPYKCLYCPKRVRSFVDLLEHERVHTGEKPFLCLKCGMRFKHKHTLTKHGARCQNTSEVQTETKRQLVVKETQSDTPTALEVATGEGIRVDITEGIAEMAVAVVDGTAEYPNLSSRRGSESPTSTSGNIFPFASTSTANESFKTSRELFMLGNENVPRDHLATHPTTESPLYCKVCSRVVRDLETLEKHRISHTPFQCNMCEEQFPVFKPLVKHYEDCHTVKRPFACSYCQEHLKSLPLFIRHEWKHTGHQPYKCMYCSKRVRSFVDLLEHERVHSGEQPFLCLKCGMKFKHKHTLTKHNARCQNKPEQAKSKTKMKLVVKETQSDPRTAPEVATGKGIKADITEDIAQRAVAVVDGPVEYPNLSKRGSSESPTNTPGEISPSTATSTANESFKTSKEIFMLGNENVPRDHLATHPTTESPLYCEVCSQVVCDLETLEKHRISHTPFQCNTCEEQFPLFKLLVKHYEDCHTVKRPFVCSYCQEHLKSLPLFIRHEWKHTGHQPYKCIYCSERVRSFVDLLEHERVHSGEQPFLCLKCGMKFKHKHTLTKHNACCQNTPEHAQTPTIIEPLNKETYINSQNSVNDEVKIKAHCLSKRCTVLLRRINTLACAPARPLRPNRGQRMKTFLEEERRLNRFHGATSEFQGLTPHNKILNTKKSQDPPCIRAILGEKASSKRMGKVCDLCNKEIEGNMRDHKMEHRRTAAAPGEVVSLVKCSECDKAFECKMSLRAHKVTHNHLYCEVCTRMVRDSKTLEKHRVTHTQFQCSKCKENFRLLKHLVTHYEDFHKLNEPYVCTQCQESCKTVTHLIKHEWKHTGHQPFKCLYCPKTIRSYADLTEHERVHTKEQPFLCWTCGNGFKHKHTLEKHVVRCQNLPSQHKKTYICAQCGHSYKCMSSLLYHEQSRHKGVRYPCTHCGKEFFSSFALVRHILIHTGEKPYKCQYGDCSKSFRSPSEVRLHTRYHTGEKPYKCHFCGKGFVQACARTLHIRSHTGERPYPCSICDKRFNSFHGLKQHKKIHEQVTLG